MRRQSAARPLEQQDVGAFEAIEPSPWSPLWPQFHNIAKALAESWQNPLSGPNFRIPHWPDSVSAQRRD